MVIIRHYLYSHLKFLFQNSLFLVNLLIFIIPQWSSAVESIDCTNPAPRCYVEQGGQKETVEITPTLELVSVLKKSEKSLIPTALVIVGTPIK